MVVIRIIILVASPTRIVRCRLLLVFVRLRFLVLVIRSFKLLLDLTWLDVLVVNIVLPSEFVVAIRAKIDAFRVVEATIRKVVEAFVVIKATVFVSFLCFKNFSVIFFRPL
jgi:hypothetical protein